MENNLENIFANEGAKAGKAFQDYVIAFGTAAPLVKNEVVASTAPRAFVAYYQHLLDLAVDHYGIPQEEPEEGQTACAGCWCNTCARLELCPNFGQSDGITPPPCSACENITAQKPLGYSEPLKPRTKLPCANYKDAPAPEV